MFQQKTVLLTIIFFVIGVTANTIFFVASFPGVGQAETSLVLNADHLPIQRDVYSLPDPPELLSTVTARNVYVSLEKPSPLPMIRYRADEIVALASLTKLMTALVALDRQPNWEREVTILKSDSRPGAKSRVYPGEVVSLNDLWQLMLVGSDNDSVIALVRGLDMSEEDFVFAMNKYARELGLKQTSFADPTGLSPLNVSTAREFAVIARVAFGRFEIAETLAELRRTIVVSGRPRFVYSTDQYLKTFTNGSKDSWVFRTGKTGYIEESGYNVALLSENLDGSIVLVIVLGSRSVLDRTKEAVELIEWSGSVFSSEELGELIGQRLVY